jgi:hypothetical protein
MKTLRGSSAHYWVASADTGGAGPPKRLTSVLALVVSGRNGIFLPLMLSNGRVVGTWRRTGRPESDARS